MKTLIAIPCFDMVHADFMRCMLDLDRPEGTNYTVIKNTLIYEARNFIAQNAIAYGFDRVLWLDSDLQFEPYTLIRLCGAMDTGKDFVSGLYFMRKMPTQPVIYSRIIYEVKGDEAFTGADPYLDYPDGLFEVAGAGFGCCMTSVGLLKRMVDRYGAPFTPLMGLGEDLSFCYRASLLGEKMYCDSRVKCGHIGTMVFTEDVYKQSKNAI